MPEIAFRMERQGATQWCWAAVAVSVNRYYDPDSKWRQCGVATYVLGAAKGKDKPAIPAAGCCSKPVPEGCNQPWWLEEALKRLGRLKGKPKEGHMSFAAIERRLKAKRPVCARIQWTGGGGHFVVISECHAYPGGRRELVVQDPRTGGEHRVEYSQFLSKYRGNGKWSHTYPV